MTAIFNFAKKIMKRVFMPTLGQLETIAAMIWKEVNSPQYNWGNWDVEVPVTTEGWKSFNGARGSAALTLPSGKSLFNLIVIAAAMKFRTSKYKKRRIHEIVAHEYRHACQFSVLREYSFAAMQKEATFRYGEGPLERDAVAYSKGQETPWKEFVESIGLGLEYKE